MRLSTDPLRIVTAAMTVMLGAVHLKLYFESYKDIPIENIGRSFLFSAFAALGAAVVVMVWSHRLAPIAPLVLANSTLIAFGLSRTDRGIFGFTERGWTPSPEAAAAVITEVAAAVFAAAALATAARANVDSSRAEWGPPGVDTGPSAASPPR